MSTSRYRTRTRKCWVRRVALLAFLTYCTITAWGELSAAEAAPPPGAACSTYKPATSSYPLACSDPSSAAAAQVPNCYEAYTDQFTQNLNCKPVYGPNLPAETPAAVRRVDLGVEQHERGRCRAAPVVDVARLRAVDGQDEGPALRVLPHLTRVVHPSPPACPVPDPLPILLLGRHRCR